MVATADITRLGPSRHRVRWQSANPEGRLDLNTQITFPSHRAGWQSALEALSPLHNPDGMFFDGFLEDRFAWRAEYAARDGEIPYRWPWVGVFHNPPEMPEWFEYHASPQVILDSWYMRKSMETCRGLFVFSDTLRTWLQQRVDVPVDRLVHPTEIPERKWTPERFRANPDPAIVQVGSWMRRMRSIRHLPVCGMSKIWVIGKPLDHAFEKMERHAASPFTDTGLVTVGEYREIDRVSDEQYDRMLSENIVFVHLYDASAVNTVVECLVRETPVLVNPLPAVVEYLGVDYPLYFDDLEEAARKAVDEALVLKAHAYLSDLDKSAFTHEYFVRSVEDSAVYQSLPAPGRRHAVVAGAPIDRLSDIDIVSGTVLQNRYVFVVAFRNQGAKIRRCMESIIRQDRHYDYGVILVDDASDDDSLARATACLDGAGVSYVAVRNGERKFYTRNLYNAVRMLISDPQTVVIEVDGDDYLEDTDVLGVLERAYAAGARRTCGRFRTTEGSRYPGERMLHERRLASVFDPLQPWHLDHCFSWMHLKTFRKHLFEEVPLRYFLERDGQRWLRMAEDLVVHPRMTEAAGASSLFIDEILYVYDFTGTEHDILDPTQAAYILDHLYRVPVGSHFGALQQSVLESSTPVSHAPYRANRPVAVEASARREEVARVTARMLAATTLRAEGQG